MELSVDQIRAAADYQKFGFNETGEIENVGARMGQKLTALENVLPEFSGKTVLDIGCDFGFWSFLASEQGATVTGLDRSRRVGSIGWVDIPALNNKTAQRYEMHGGCTFVPYEAGVQWHEFGHHDVVLCMSLYHHIFQNTGGDHESIWYWLWRHTADTLIWENPVDNRDRVVQMNVSPQLHDRYTEEKLREYATKYFNFEYEGPALHEPYRVIWKLKPKEIAPIRYEGVIVKGAGGATNAFLHNGQQRITDIWMRLGIKPYPGSLNLHMDSDFNWNQRYYRTLLPDVENRRLGLNSPWVNKVMRFYPVQIDGIDAYAMRFEGERYPLNLVELIAAERLRNHLDGRIELWQ